MMSKISRPQGLETIHHQMLQAKVDEVEAELGEQRWEVSHIRYGTACAVLPTGHHLTVVNDAELGTYILSPNIVTGPVLTVAQYKEKYL